MQGRKCSRHWSVRILITNDAIRHIKKKHGENENLRGQINLSPEDIALLPYIINNYDSIDRTPKQDDSNGNKSIT